MVGGQPPPQAVLRCQNPHACQGGVSQRQRQGRAAHKQRAPLEDAPPEGRPADDGSPERPEGLAQRDGLDHPPLAGQAGMLEGPPAVSAEHAAAMGVVHAG